MLSASEFSTDPSRVCSQWVLKKNMLEDSLNDGAQGDTCPFRSPVWPRPSSSLATEGRRNSPWLSNFRTFRIFNPAHSRPSIFFFFKQKDMFLPLLFIWTVCWGKGHPSDLSTYRRFITGGGGRAKVEQDTIFPSLLCFWNGRTKSVAPQFCPKSRNKAIMEAANEKSSL